MLRTNSKGSVVSVEQQHAAEPDNLRRSLEILEGRMEGLRIPEEDVTGAILGSVQPRKSQRATSSEHSHPELERPQSRGHITPPVLFPRDPGNSQKEIRIEIDDQATPMPTKSIDFDFGDQPTPKALSENGSTKAEEI